MTSRTKVSRSNSRRPSIASAVSVVTEALEDRKLFSVGLVSVGVGGVAANGDSGEASVSSDGRYVAFSSYATNLVSDDTNGKRDIFLRDRQNGTTILISRNSSTNAVGNGDSNLPVISQDGNYVAFSSRASNLVANDTLGFQDVFRYNISTGALQLVSATNTAGTTFASGNSSEPTISKDGNIVSFTSYASNVAGVDGNAANDVFVRNMTTGQNKLVSVNTGGVAAGNNVSFDSWISEDGRYITFRSDATNLVASDTNGNRDTFLRDMQTNTTRLISVNSGGTVGGNASSDSNSVSGDGQFVTFQSKATDIVGNDGNGTADVFLRNTNTNRTTLLSINRFGTASAGGFSEFPALSQDGSYATFSSTASDIVATDANGREDIFLRDLARGPITLLSVNTSGASANGRSFDPFLSRDGNFIVYTSDATDMTSAVATSGKANIFLATAPNPSTDNTPPTAAVGTSDSASPGDTTYHFTVNLSDNIGLNTVALGNLTVQKSGGGALTATFDSVVGTGATAVATYTVAFPSGINTNDTGVYSVTVPSNAIKDASGNAIAGGTGIGSFTLSIGDPNGPDIIVSGVSRQPASVIGGKSGKIKFKATNGGPGLLSAPVSFTVYASADGTIDAGDVALGTVTKTLKLKVRKAKSLSLKFTYPSTIGDGNYFLIVKADSGSTVAESNENNNTVASTTSTLIRQPFFDLQPTFVSKPSKFTHGVAATITATIKNNGNVKFKAGVPLKLVITSDGTVTDSSTVLTTVTPTLSISNGKSKSVKFKVTLPGDLVPGAYQIGIDVDSSNAIAESDEANNLATSFIFNSL